MGQHDHATQCGRQTSDAKALRIGLNQAHDYSAQLRRVTNYCPEGALQCLACQTAKDNLRAVNTDCAVAPLDMPRANSHTGNLWRIRRCVKLSKKACGPQSGTLMGTQADGESTACIAHHCQLGLLYSATQGRLCYTGDRKGRPRGIGGTKKQERRCTPRCQRCTGHTGVQAPTSAMAG